jgi:DNA-binding Lrp family transcriptional regulator
MLTDNEKNVLRFLLNAFDTEYSINNIAKQCNLAPNGALKILKKFEKEGILKVKKIANIKSYKINFDNDKTEAVLELTLTSTLEGRMKNRFDDIKELKESTEACILFGSYISKQNPQDMDVLFVLSNFKEYRRKLRAIKEVLPVKVHDVIQTEDDLKKNILDKDKVITEILKTGIIFWGQRTLIKVIKDAYQRQTS